MSGEELSGAPAVSKVAWKIKPLGLGKTFKD
jgi:hypothetical protein